MSIKLKALGLALFASLAIGAVSVVSATGSTGGHFTSDAPSGVADLDGHQVSSESSYFENISGGFRFTCPNKSVTYTGNVGGSTQTQIKTKAAFGAGCNASGFGGGVLVEMENCDFLVTTQSAEPNHTAVHLDCENPEEEVLLIYNPAGFGECIIHFPQQTPTAGGIVLTTAIHEEKHGITVDVTFEGITQNKTEIGFLGCFGDGGEQNDSLVRSTITITADDFSSGAAVNITATGP